MASVINQTFIITVSKLVKQGGDATVMSDEQMISLMETLPTVVEGLLEDDKLVVEIGVSDDN
jgi:hypothetical protein